MLISPTFSFMLSVLRVKYLCVTLLQCVLAGLEYVNAFTWQMYVSYQSEKEQP